MSATALSDIQTIIERSLFETIRLELVDKGYLPDIALYPNSEAGTLAYNTALKTIQEGPLGFAIELFNESTSTSKGVKKIPRITLNSGNFLPGALGGDPQRYFENKGDHYQALVTPPQIMDFYLDFVLSTNSVKQERVLNAILALAIPRRGYIPHYTDASTRFFVRYLNYYNADDNQEGIIEKVYSYEISDVWDTNDKEFDSNVAKMLEITANIYIKNPPAELDKNNISCSSTLSGILTAVGVLTGDIYGSSTLLLIVTVESELVGGINGSSTLSGILTAPGILTGDIYGSSTLLLTIPIESELVGGINGSSTLSGILTAPGILVGGINGSSTLSGILPAIGTLSGDINSSSTLSGTISPTGNVPILGDINCSSTLSGILTINDNISGDINCSSTLYGDISKYGLDLNEAPDLDYTPDLDEIP